MASTMGVASCNAERRGDIMDSSIPEPSFLWTTLFMVGSYAMAASCLFWGIWEGTQRSSTLSKWKSASGQVLTFALLAGVYWFVESWAHYRTPFYLYSGQFPDLLSRLPFESWHLSRGVDNDCIKNVLVRA